MTSNNLAPIQIKAKRNGFLLMPDPEASFDSVMEYLNQHLKESQDFFKRSEMTLDLRARPLRTDEISALHSLLVEKAQVKLVEVKLTETLSFVVDRPLIQQQSPPPSSVPSRQATSARITVSPLIVRNTCRSGTRIESQADCVVLGDVNPGAEVVAVGDIIIFGNLRGIAHAGADGDRSARIWALSIEPSQIRIADLVAVPPKGSKPAAKRFEIAEVQKDMIEVILL